MPRLAITLSSIVERLKQGYQIVTAGKHFRTVTNGLWPFKLAPPKGGMRQKRRHFVEGGDYGNRDTLINRFLARCI